MNTIKVNNIAELKQRKGTENSSITLLGYYTSGDGGGGEFYWDNSSTETDNGGTIIQVNTISIGRWKRIFDSEVSVKWFGLKGDSTTDNAVNFNKCILYCSLNKKSIFINSGTYLIQSPLYLYDNTTIRGEGKTSIILNKSAISSLESIIKNTTSIYNVSLSNFQIEGNYSSKVTNSIGLNLSNINITSIYDISILYFDKGIVSGLSKSSYYTKLLNINIGSCNKGIQLTYGANEFFFNGGRVYDCLTGIEENDTTGNTYLAVSIESNTNYGFDIAGTNPVQGLKIIGCRFESLVLGNVGIRLNNLCQNTHVISNYFSGYVLANMTVDNGTDTTIFQDQLCKILGRVQVYDRPSDQLVVKSDSAVTNTTQIEIQTKEGGYGAGINFTSPTSVGGNPVSMCKILVDGESSWNDVASTQDAIYKFLLTLNGTPTEVYRIKSGGEIIIGTTSYLPSAKVNIESTTQGLLLPRMTTIQKNAITSPANGLIVYDTTLNTLCVYESNAWKTVTTS